MTYTTVLHCGNEHSEWLKSLDFYDEELDTLENRLVEIVKKNNSHEVMAEVEHFQNQFIIQRNNIDELKHSIHEHSGKVAADAQLHAGKMETSLLGEHGGLKEQFDSFEKVINELRQEFNRFLSNRM
jgi:NAD-dependent SIR2 family protein deacetylase